MNTDPEVGQSCVVENSTDYMIPHKKCVISIEVRLVSKETIL